MGKKGGNEPGKKKDIPPQPESVASLLKPVLDGLSACVQKLNLAPTAGVTNHTSAVSRSKRGRENENEDEVAGGAPSSADEVEEVYVKLADNLTTLNELLETYQRALLPCASVIVSYLTPIIHRHRAPIQAWRCAAACATLFGPAAVQLTTTVVEHLVNEIKQGGSRLVARWKNAKASSNVAEAPILIQSDSNTNSKITSLQLNGGEDIQYEIPADCGVMFHPALTCPEKIRCFSTLLSGTLEYSGSSSSGSSAVGDGSLALMSEGLLVRLLSAWRRLPLSFSIVPLTEGVGSREGTTPFLVNDRIAEELCQLTETVVLSARPLLPELLAEIHLFASASTFPYSIGTRGAAARLRRAASAMQHPDFIPLNASAAAGFVTLPEFAKSSTTATVLPAANVLSSSGEAVAATTLPSDTQRASTSGSALLASFFTAPTAAPPAVEPSTDGPSTSSTSGGVLAEEKKAIPASSVTNSTSATTAAAATAAPTATEEIPEILDSDDDE